MSDWVVSVGYDGRQTLYMTTATPNTSYGTSKILMFLFFCFVPDVATEKTHKALVEGVEAFDSSKLKHTETHEKNLLPDKDGNQ